MNVFWFVERICQLLILKYCFLPGELVGWKLPAHIRLVFIMQLDWFQFNDQIIPSRFSQWICNSRSISNLKRLWDNVSATVFSYTEAAKRWLGVCHPLGFLQKVLRQSIRQENCKTFSSFLETNSIALKSWVLAIEKWWAENLVSA